MPAPTSPDLLPTDVIRRFSPDELRTIADLIGPGEGADELRSIAEKLARGETVVVERPASRTVFLPSQRSI